MGTAAHAGWREASPFGRTRDGSVIVAGRFLSVAAGTACYALLSPPLPGRFGRVRCSVLLGRRGALRFRGLLAFLTWPGTWATSSKTVSLGLSAWTVVVLPFRDAFAVFPLRVLSVGAGELAFLDWGAPDLAFLRGSPTVITKVDSKLRSLESPVCFRLGGWVRLGINMVSVKNCGLAVFTPVKVPKFLRWGHAEPLWESLVVLCLGSGNEPTAGSLVIVPFPALPWKPLAALFRFLGRSRSPPAGRRRGLPIHVLFLPRMQGGVFCFLS